MKNGRPQIKDIPTLPILRFLLAHKHEWCNWFGDKFDNSVTHAMPRGTPPKLVRAKMNKLMLQGLIEGCPCGCRGDYEINEKGSSTLSLFIISGCYKPEKETN